MPKGSPKWLNMHNTCMIYWGNSGVDIFQNFFSLFRFWILHFWFLKKGCISLHSSKLHAPLYACKGVSVFFFYLHSEWGISVIYFSRVYFYSWNVVALYDNASLPFLYLDFESERCNLTLHQTRCLLVSYKGVSFFYWLVRNILS